MTAKTKSAIKAFFETGDKPTESQFTDLIDSYVDKSGPIGTLETLASGGATGFTNWTGGTPAIENAATTKTNLSITVETTAKASAVASQAITNAQATTAQATAGTTATGIMTPVLVQKAIDDNAATWSVLASASFSGVSEIDITGLSKNTELIFFDLTVDATASFRVRVSRDNGSNFDATSGDYIQEQIASTSGAASNSQRLTEDHIPLGFGGAFPTTTRDTGVLQFFAANPANSSQYKGFEYNGGFVDTDGGKNTQTFNGSFYRVTSEAVDAFRLYVPTGNMSGKYKILETD